MKLLTSLAFTIALVAPVLAQTPTPTAAEAQAKEELNEAARVFRDGNFAQAQLHSEKALQLDPQNKTAPYFVARSIHAQYKRGETTPENIEKARQAIVAYQRILERSHDDDESYKAVAYLYDAINEDKLLRQWVLQRALDASFATDKRAEAYISLASKDWDCSYKFTEQSDRKVTVVKGGEPSFKYRMPKDRAEFEQARDCANRGMEMVNAAITLTPENENAWAYKANLLFELSKFAEMVGQVQQKRELLRQYEEALNETTKLSKRAAQRNP